MGNGTIGGQKRFMPRAVILIEHEAVADGGGALQSASGSERQRVLGADLGVGEVAGLGESHAEDIKDHGLAVAAELISACSQRNSHATVARPGIGIGCEIMGDAGEQLIIIGGRVERNVQLGEGVGILAQPEKYAGTLVM